MTDKAWDKAFELLMSNEGEFQSDPKDRGNWTSGKIGVGELKGTKYGICAMAYPELDIPNLTLHDAKAIYYRDYWLRCKCDKLPDCLSIAVFDYAVNSGIKRAIKTLQKVLGVTVDGIIGNQTIGASTSKPLRETLKKYQDERLDFLISLESFSRYGKGWTNRVNRVLKVCEELCE